MIVHDMLQNKTHFKCSTFTVKRLSTMWETRVRPLGQEDPLEKEMATHVSILAWRILQTEGPGGLQSMRLRKSRTRLIEHYRVGSVRFSCSVMSNSLQHHESQHSKASLSITNSRSSPQLMCIESVMYWTHHNEFISINSKMILQNIVKLLSKQYQLFLYLRIYVLS